MNVEIEKEILEKAIEFLNALEDEGPTGSGWKSDTLKAVIFDMEIAIGTPEDELWYLKPSGNPAGKLLQR